MKILFIILLIAHLYEEQYRPGGFQGWWNNKLWRSKEVGFPLTHKANLKRNTYGLLLVGILLAVLGIWWTPALFIFVGFILCDGLLHIGLSIEHGYFPGAWTSLAYVLASGWFLYHYQPRPELWPIFMLIGVIALLWFYFESFMKVHKRKSGE